METVSLKKARCGRQSKEFKKARSDYAAKLTANIQKLEEIVKELETMMVDVKTELEANKRELRITEYKDNT